MMLGRLVRVGDKVKIGPIDEGRRRSLEDLNLLLANVGREFEVVNWHAWEEDRSIVIHIGIVGIQVFPGEYHIVKRGKRIVGRSGS